MSEYVLCYYHRSDFDGHCSAAIVDDYCKRHDKKGIFIGVDYTDDFSELPCLTPAALSHYHPHLLTPSDVALVVVADFSFPLNTWETLRDVYGQEKLMWFDHHKSALEDAEDTWLTSLAGTRRLGVGACELVSQYFLRRVPQAVRLMSQYDVWDKSDEQYWDTHIHPYHLGCLSSLGPRYEETHMPWDLLFHNGDEEGSHIDRVIRAGYSIHDYTDAVNRKIVADAAYKSTFEGHTALVCNGSSPGSGLLIDSFSDEHDLMIIFRQVKDQWVVGLYTTPDRGVDCSALAKKHGGGGHPGAAGFRFPASTPPVDYFPVDK